MKRFILNTSFFLIICLISYPALVFVWGKTMHPRLHPNLNHLLGAYGHNFTRSKEVKTKENIDVLFLGSSHAYRGFDPRIFEKQGLSVFNLGSSSQSPLQTNVLLKRYLQKLNPELVVYEVYPATFWSDGVESSLDILANDEVDLNALKMAISINHIKVYNALFYSYFAQKGHNYKTFQEEQRIDNDSYIKGGFVQKDLAFYYPRNVNAFSWKLKDKQLEAFEENIALIEEQGAKIMLVMAPITQNRYSKARNNQYFDSTMTSYGHFINFNHSSSLIDSVHFYDEHHLNQKGVEAFNGALIPIIENYTSGSVINSPSD